MPCGSGGGEVPRTVAAGTLRVTPQAARLSGRPSRQGQGRRGSGRSRRLVAQVLSPQATRSSCISQASPARPTHPEALGGDFLRPEQGFCLSRSDMQHHQESSVPGQ